MARPLRIEFKGAWYHALNRGLERRIIFRDDDDRRFFFSLLGEVSATFGIEIHAYSLMDNHYHLLIHTPYAQLGRAMRYLNGVYTQRFNKKWHRDGPLFRGRYKAVLVDEDYFLELVSYIHLNPVKAGLVAQAQAHPWTSHAIYSGSRQIEKPQWLHTEKILSLLNRVQNEYEKNPRSSFVTEEFLRNIASKKLAIGRKGFAEWIEFNYSSKKIKLDKEIPKRAKMTITRPAVKQILSSVAFAFDLKPTELRIKSRQNSLARNTALYLLRQTAGLSHKQVARWLNVSNDYAAAKAFERMKLRLKRNRSLEKNLHNLQRTIEGVVK